MQISPNRDFIEKIRANTDIVEVIGRYVKLDHNKGLCPFHNDTQPSLSVNARGQYYFCFGCHCGGDVFDFLVRIESITFWDAVIALGKEAGIELESLSDETRESCTKARQKEDILAKATEFYLQDIPATIIEHLMVGRGFTRDTIDRFHIGYARGGLKHHLIAQHAQ